MVEVSFTSEPLHTAVMWSFRNVNIASSDRYSMELEDSLASPGEHVATLVITDLTNDDMGLYKVAVRNDVGVTEHNFIISRGMYCRYRIYQLCFFMVLSDYSTHFVPSCAYIIMYAIDGTITM